MGPIDPTTYLEVFDSLRKTKGLKAGPNVLRFTALSLASSTVEEPEMALRETADLLYRETGFFSPLRSVIRFALAAMVIRRGLDPARVLEGVEATLESFKEEKLSRSSVQGGIAAFLLCLDAGGQAAPTHRVRNTKAILDRWNEDHRWLTGTDDLPMAAFHATRDLPPEEVGRRVEDLYQALRERGYRRGNGLQLATHLLCVSAEHVVPLAERFHQVATALEEQGIKVRPSTYDETALLSLTSLEPAEAAGVARDLQQRLREHKPKPPAPIAFSLAVGLILARETERIRQLEGTGDLAALDGIRGIIEAQQAAMAAAIASSAAVAAATSGS